MIKSVRPILSHYDKNRLCGDRPRTDKGDATGMSRPLCRQTRTGRASRPAALRLLEDELRAVVANLSGARRQLDRDLHWIVVPSLNRSGRSIKVGRIRILNRILHRDANASARQDQRTIRAMEEGECDFVKRLIVCLHRLQATGDRPRGIRRIVSMKSLHSSSFKK